MHRLRKNGLKIQHSILDGLKPVLEKVLGDRSEVTRIIPGEIKITKGVGQGKTVGVRVTVPLMTAETQSGFKVIALASGARQELFVNTFLAQSTLEDRFSAAGAIVTRRTDTDEAC